uniref:Uncharacterized protein n=1 Tax=Kalanchoe fedtschenkoi TaxID=63787 RepID=A0A7N1A2X9_KALFE
MGFPENITSDPTLDQSNLIMGFIDSGIWPESKSFSDEGLGPVPKKWKGACQGGRDFKCNRKIIGARTYVTDTARDEVGHGTHTASIAAGNKMAGASFYDIVAKGTARGGAPSSRIAAYKVCTMNGCSKSDILAAFDDAIADGVDIITLPIGGVRDGLVKDVIAIGAFHAMAKGIVTVNSAGDSGPLSTTIHHQAPWFISVGASNTDRVFIDKVVLGDGKTLTGRSLNIQSLGKEPKYPLTYANKLGSNADAYIRLCFSQFIDKELVKDKIVMCTSKLGRSSLHAYGAAGVISSTYNSYSDYPVMYKLPAVYLESEDFAHVEAYANATGSGATILESEDGRDTHAPVVASFSSRGPNYHFPDILKPDVIAPGIGILAAYSSDLEYNVISGTSASCPHAAGAIAYIKSVHPDWSAAALQSALMTTARPLKASMYVDKEFSYGSGHIDPMRAADPGLIYDVSKQDYINLLCGAYDADTCHKISGEECHCPQEKTAPNDLNYPSMTKMLVNVSERTNVSFARVVTNVGQPNSTYKATVVAARKLKIKVVPDTLSFEGLNEKKSFQVQVTGGYPRKGKVLSSSLVWFDGKHTVRSPIVLYALYDEPASV